MIRYLLSTVVLCFTLSAVADDVTPLPAPVAPARDLQFFELRTYHAAPGKLTALRSRFRNFENKLFVKHGIAIVGSWTPINKDGLPENGIVYILGFPNREARDKSWKEFTDDLEWLAVKTDTERNGKLIDKVDTLFMTPTDFPAVTPTPSSP